MINGLARPVNKITSAVQPNGDADQGIQLTKCTSIDVCMITLLNRGID